MARGLQKYAKTAAMAGASFVGDSPLFLMDYALRLLRVIVLMSLWRTLFQGQTQLSGFTLPVLLTYTLIAEAFAGQLEAATDVAGSFWDGTIATRFIKPMSVFGQYIAETLGKWAFTFATFSLPLLLLAPLFGVNPLPASPLAGLLFIVSLSLGASVGFALEFLFAAFAIRLQFPPFAVDRARAASATLLSGAFLPLALLPWHLGRVFGWLPFASMASTPLRIYTGTENVGGLLLTQLFWAVTLWPCAAWMWRVNQERMVAYGG